MVVAFLIGTDEAGYGPNLGPLTIGGTLWRVPDTATDLYDVLQADVSADRRSDRLVVADSKQVYQSGQSIEALERTVLAFLHLASQQIPDSFQHLGKLLGFELQGFGPGLVEASDIALPLCAERSEIETGSARLRQTLAEAGCALEACRTVAIFPARFNASVEQLGNKAELLSSETLSLAGRLISLRPAGDDSDVWIGCDKHGGRNKYAGMLNQYLTDEFVKIDRETREASEYHWQQERVTVSIRFQVRGENLLPVALSSMMAKYVREIAMYGWNRFWQGKMPGIRPTQGYPVDARRFKKEIAELQRSLGIEDQQVWRSR
ncbi:MAG: hypothetical protein MK108_14555 [Mariniblastus sp.]|nr:hypothetical protein [Mariniblastus sp.]